MVLSHCAMWMPGALVSAGNTLLFRIAQTQKLRMYVSVPQIWVSSIRTAKRQYSGNRTSGPRVYRHGCPYRERAGPNEPNTSG